VIAVKFSNDLKIIVTELNKKGLAKMTANPFKIISFIIITSGSMQRNAWSLVRKKWMETN